MDLITVPAIIVSLLTIAGSAAFISAWFRRSQGDTALQLAERVNALLKEENEALIRKNTALQATVDSKDIIIERLTTNASNTARRNRKKS